MKRLFVEGDRYSNEAHDLDRAVANALKPILDLWVAEGYSIRDIGVITEGAVRDYILMELLGWGVKARADQMC